MTEDRISKLPSPLEEMVLYAILDVGEKEAYTTPLLARLKHVSGKEIAAGALYTVLGRLEEKGFVESELGDPTPERGGKRKRLYRVNAAVTKWREALSVIRPQATPAGPSPKPAFGGQW